MAYREDTPEKAIGKLTAVLIKDLAKQLNVDRSNLFKWLRKNGFTVSMFDVRRRETRWQAAKAVSPETAKDIKALRREQGWE